MIAVVPAINGVRPPPPPEPLAEFRVSHMSVAVCRVAPDNRYMGNNMSRLEGIPAELPEAVRVDVERWEGCPTFRVLDLGALQTEGDRS